MSESLDAAAATYDAIAAGAAAHARRAAEHFRNADVPRGAAHAWAAQGHVHDAQEQLAAQSREHARRSQP